MQAARYGLVILGLAVAAQAAPAQTVPVKEDKAGLLARARITPDSATHLAQARLPHARIVAAEIEVEGGRLIYSFDMQTPGKRGIDEVQVDAGSGKVLGVEHEDAAAEARERKADSAKARP